MHASVPAEQLQVSGEPRWLQVCQGELWLPAFLAEA